MILTAEVDSSPLLNAFDNAIAAVSTPDEYVWQSLIGELAAEDQVAQFDLYSSGGGTWAPLAPSTVAEKKAEGFPPDKVVRTYALRNSLTPDGSMHVCRMIADGIEVGTSDPIAEYHQNGTERMPARPPVNPPTQAAESQMMRSARISFAVDISRCFKRD